MLFRTRNVYGVWIPDRHSLLDGLHNLLDAAAILRMQYGWNGHRYISIPATRFGLT